MKIAILGAGAMGAMVGAYLKKGGGEVYFVDPYEAHMKAVSENGLFMEIEGHAPETVRVDGATIRAEDVGVCDVVILLVKGINTTSSVQNNKALFGDGTVVLTLQNGIGNADLLKRLLPEENIGHGILKSSATLYAPGKIFGRDRFPDSPAGAFFYPLGKETRRFDTYRRLVDIFTAGGFIARLDENIEAIIWDKLYNNAVFNCPCAILQIAPQDFISHEMGTELYKHIGREVCAVATAKGIPMDAEDYWTHHGLPSIPKGPVTERHYTSAIHDVSRGNRTEVDFLNGAVYREGQKLGVPAPYNETIWRMTRILEDTYDLKYVPES
ncbi:2-dehydropantoate 2-reductase [Sporobacter termitidis DSM 10068]|uniref:2-dehydropantoate 2-reductase n=1 Tax=Sporobacter termitidis DSM 10068 TaxID=1123282 RepID=A0A1M5TYQ3_9FIRM|nr:2-dehydropantoate 2-reductase [Sporobacter termitidis]SHH55824.1 2-dehydropantoate 2-reductase [Sporobacter termitidis DSM 10068]